MAIDPRRGAFAVVGLVLALVVWAGVSHVPVAGAVGDANQAACPNEGNTGFSAELPDCRAYEQVSPPFKDGYSVSLGGLVGDSSSLFGQSIGFFSGATSNLDCPYAHYEWARGTAGWLTTALNDAPLSQFAYPAVCGQVVSGEQGASLLALHPTSSSVYAADLYLRRPEDPEGSYVEVGPLVPPSAVPSTPTGDAPIAPVISPVRASRYLYATPGLSHVLFQLPALSVFKKEALPPGVSSYLWPGDTTILGSNVANFQSLYEYAGTGRSEPSLVGLDNEGRLISDCTTSAGGPTGEASRNPISTDGSRIFFTSYGADDENCSSASRLPPVDELFVRLDNGEPGAGSLAISQPQALPLVDPSIEKYSDQEDCTTTLCQENTSSTREGSALIAHEPGDFRDARFEGASADGSKVFFASTQQLADPASQDPDPADSAVPSATGAESGCAFATGPGGCNLYLYDLYQPEGRRLIDLSAGAMGGEGPRVQGVAGVSEDGSHIYFVAKGALTGSQQNEYGAAAAAGQDNLYVADTVTGQLTFIASLAASDASQWVPTDQGGPMNVTDDGDFLLFTSSKADLTPDDTSTAPQLFRYDASTATLVRVSVGNEGFNRDGNASLGASGIARETNPPGETSNEDPHPAISENGQVIAFASPAALAPGAFDDRCLERESGGCGVYAQNAYEWRAGHVYLIDGGSGAGPEIGTPPAVSSSGADFFFATTDPRLASDTDGVGDIYDAREDGGFLVSAAPPACESEACQGNSGSPPVFGAPASTTFSGGGNLAPPVAQLVKPKTKVLTRAQKLSKALKACEKQIKKQRAACEKRAEKSYGRGK